MLLKDNHPILISTSDIYEVCKPLQKIGISYFSHARLLKNFSMTVLCNNLEFTKYCFSHDVNDYALPYLDSKYRIWNQIFTPEFIRLIKDFGLVNCFEIMEKKTNHIDTFCFGTNLNYDSFITFCYENIDLLEKFIEYFLNKTESLLNDCIKKAVACPFVDVKKIEPINLLENFNFSVNTDKKQEFLCDIGIINSKFGLSDREIQCLKNIAKGKTAKEIARIMKISSRTVETHILNLKNKLKCYSKSNLAEIFWSSGIHLL